MNPARGLVYCRPVCTSTTFAGGVIELLEDTRERWVSQQAEIVSVGALEVCEDADCDRYHVYDSLPVAEGDTVYTFIPKDRTHLFHAKAGDWVLVAPRQFTEVEDGLWALPQDSVMAILRP